MFNKYIVVWDLDGTLACGQHRLHLLPTKDLTNTNSWDGFNAACGGDAPIQDNIDLCIGLAWLHTVVILTGRSNKFREETKAWLRDNGVGYDTLIMRDPNDHRSNPDFKEEELRKLGLNNILCAFDDLEHVVKRIRSLGVTCHQVTHYDTPRTDTREV